MSKNKWQSTPPPNEITVEVEHEGKIIDMQAFYGRDGYRPHWKTPDGNEVWDVATFPRWRTKAKRKK